MFKEPNDLYFMPAQLGPGYRSPQYHLQEERRVGFCRFQKPEGQLYIVYNSIVLCFFSLKILDFAQIIISLQNINLLEKVQRTKKLRILF